MLFKLNKHLEKLMPILTPTSLLLGILMSVSMVEFSFLIPWIFAFCTFAGSLGSNLQSLREAILHPLPILIAISLLHVIMPLWAWGIGSITFNGDIYTITGFILGMAIPTGITSLIWVSIYKGNIAMTLSIILIDTLLSPFLVPMTISFIIGHKIEMEITSIMTGLLGMIVIPSLLGIALNHLTKGKVKTSWCPGLAPFAKIGLCLVVLLNGAVVAPFLKNPSLKLLMIALVVLFIAITGYLFAFLLGILLKRDREIVMALTFTAGMRNISAGSVIAITYFPPQVAVPVVIAMLFQQVLASLTGYLTERYYNRNTEKIRSYYKEG
jgi:bile acid:Na+ symporter, BASS family